MSLATLDLSQFVSGTHGQRAEFAEALLTGFTKHGFVKLTNHGFSTGDIVKLFSQSKTFFEMPQDLKSQVANPPGPSPQRGWTGVGIEATSRLTQEQRTLVLKDIKEHFDQGSAEDPQYPNRWPKENQLPGFCSFMEWCYTVCEGICMQLMKALEIGLDLPADSLTGSCTPSASDLRLNHYPSTRSNDLQDGFASRISPHTDFGIVSLLLQDEVGGLEIENRGSPKSYIPVPPCRSEMIVNVSDTLQRWTNDVLEAGVHRVTGPSGSLNNENSLIPERFSMAYFFKAGREVSVGPLRYFVSAQRPPRYQHLTALEFQKWRNQKMYAG